MAPPARTLALCAVLVLAGCTVASPGPTQDPGSGDGVSPDTTTPFDGGNLTLPSADRVTVEVVDVADGDTVDVELPNGSVDTVRLVGVDSPETYVENDPAEYEGVPETDAGAACLRSAGHNSTDYLQGRLPDGEVTLVFDPDTDRRGYYGRLLAYVYVDGENVNYDLVATGHARVYDSDFVFRDRFDAAEQRAREHNRGLWHCQRES